MGAYDDIGIPVKGQPISSGAYGTKVRNAIIDLDRRVSSVDTSTGTGRVFSTSSIVLTTTTETAALTLTGMVFKAGLAYECSIRSGLGLASTISPPARAGWANFRIRKYNATPASGTDYGEYFRTQGVGVNIASVLGTIFLLNNTSVDVTNDINLTVAAACDAGAAISGTNTVTIFGNTASPRFLIIKPAGFAADYAGMGIQVA